MKNKILFIIFTFLSLFLITNNAYAVASDRKGVISYQDYNSIYFDEYNLYDLVQLIINEYNLNKTSSSPELLIYFLDSDNSDVRIYANYVIDSPIKFIYYFNSTSYPNRVLNSFSFKSAFSSSSWNASTSSSNSSILSTLDNFIEKINNSIDSYDTVVAPRSTGYKTVTCGSLSGCNLTSQSSILYYSGDQSNLLYDFNGSITESNNYYLPYSYTNEQLLIGSYFPTYFQYLGLSPVPDDEPELPDPDDIQISNFTNNYYGFMLSQIPVSNIYDYKVRFTVGQRLIYSDIDYQYNLFGRVNHGTYFTYEPISCTVGTSNEEPFFGSENFLDSSNVYQSKTFGIMDCSSDLTKYDYVYVNAFNDNFDDNDIVYFGYTSNYGYVNVNDFIANPTKLIDYFDFIKTSNMFISSNCTSCSLYYGSSNLNNFVYSSYDLTTFKHKNYFIASPVDSKFVNFEKFEYIGQNTNQGLGFNLYSNYDSGSLYILVDSDNLVSFDSNISTNNSFTYIDSIGNVTNNNFDVFYSYDPNVGTNVDSYFRIVSTYIDSISNDIKSISDVFQHVYDLTPEFLQTLILVFYILAMSYILFKIIRK